MTMLEDNNEMLKGIKRMKKIKNIFPGNIVKIILNLCLGK